MNRMPAESSIRDMQMEGREFEGSLRVFKFPEILQFLSLGKRTGTLELTQEARRVELSFREGRIININTPERSMRLGQMLVYSGAVSREALEKALEAQDMGGGTKFLGELLIEQGAISSDPLKEALRHQLEEDIWDLFSWDSGNFRFDQAGIKGTGAIEVDLEIAPLLAEGQRRMLDWQQLCQTITNPQEVFRINPEFAGASDQPVEEKVWRVLSLINGRLTVDSLVRFSNLGKFATYSALDFLLRADVIVRSSEAAKDNRPLRPASGPGAGGAATIRLNVSDFQQPPPIEAAPAPEAGGKSKKGAKGGKGFLGMMKSAASELKPEAPIEAQREFVTDVGLVCGVLNAATHKLISAGVLTQTSAPEMVGWMWQMAEQRFPRADILRYESAMLSSELYDRYAKLEGGITRALAGSHNDCLEALRLLLSRLREKAAENMGGEEAAAVALDKVIGAFANSTTAIKSPDFSLQSWRDGSLGPINFPAVDKSHKG